MSHARRERRRKREVVERAARNTAFFTGEPLVTFGQNTVMTGGTELAAAARWWGVYTAMYRTGPGWDAMTQPVQTVQAAGLQGGEAEAVVVQWLDGGRRGA